ncbi:MAG: DUF3006 domain-containing protein [Ruminococcus sp.]|nr:DUF3006 domain-containing protein [Ruminococcus sp.]
MRYYVDRIEEGAAVCEDEEGKKAIIPAAKLYGGAKSGDVLVRYGSLYIRESGSTAGRKAKLAEKARSLTE